MILYKSDKDDWVQAGNLKKGDTFILGDEPHIVVSREGVLEDSYDWVPVLNLMNGDIITLGDTTEVEVKHFTLKHN